jgi:hypothetical protein
VTRPVRLAGVGGGPHRLGSARRTTQNDQHCHGRTDISSSSSMSSVALGSSSASAAASSHAEVSPFSAVSTSATVASTTAIDGDDDEVVLPNMVPAEDGSGKLYYFSFPPWPKQPGLLRIDQVRRLCPGDSLGLVLEGRRLTGGRRRVALRSVQFQSQGLVNQSWPAGTFRPDDDEDGSGDEKGNEHAGQDGFVAVVMPLCQLESPRRFDALTHEPRVHPPVSSGVPTVDLDIEHFTDRKKKRKNRTGNKSKKPRAPRMQMRRKGIVRTEDLFGPGGWDGPELVETRGKEPYDACVCEMPLR